MTEPLPSPPSNLTPFKFSTESPIFIPTTSTSTSASRGSINIINIDTQEEINIKEIEKIKVREDKIIKLVEFYISDENLLIDKYLQYAMSNNIDNYIKLNTICSFNRMKKLKANTKRLAELLLDNNNIILSENHKLFKRKLPLSNELLLLRRSIIIEKEEDLLNATSNVSDELWTESGIKELLKNHTPLTITFRSLSSDNRIKSNNYASSPMFSPSSPALPPALKDSLASPFFLSSSPVETSMKSSFTPVAPISIAPMNSMNPISIGPMFSGNNSNSTNIGSVPLPPTPSISSNATQVVVVFNTIEDALKALDFLSLDTRFKSDVECASFLSFQRENQRDKKRSDAPQTPSASTATPKFGSMPTPKLGSAATPKLNSATPKQTPKQAPSIAPISRIETPSLLSVSNGVGKSPTLVATFRKSPQVTPQLVPVTSEDTKGVFGNSKWRKNSAASPQMNPISIGASSPSLTSGTTKMAKGPDTLTKGFSKVRTPIKVA